MTHAAHYETPAFAPGMAFAWTLRSAEIARRQDEVATTRRPVTYQLPAFSPGVPFSWTLRSAEIARAAA